MENYKSMYCAAVALRSGSVYRLDGAFLDYLPYLEKSHPQVEVACLCAGSRIEAFHRAGMGRLQARPHIRWLGRALDH